VWLYVTDFLQVQVCHLFNGGKGFADTLQTRSLQCVKRLFLAERLSQICVAEHVPAYRMYAKERSSRALFLHFDENRRFVCQGVVLDCELFNHFGELCDDSAPDYSRAKSGCTQPKRLVFRQLVVIRARNVDGVCKSGCIVEMLWCLTLCCASVSTQIVKPTTPAN
jgi:hypothetical protein